jgi:hypothetical protein
VDKPTTPDPYAHRPWCAESDCYNRASDGEPVHLSGGESFVAEDTGRMLTVTLIDRGNGPEVKVTVDTPAVTGDVVLIPEMTYDLAHALIRHAGCAMGHSQRPV